MNALGGNNVNSQLPLAGAILCCTAIPPEHRAQLATIGAQMGATIKLDLTSDVTHLIVGSINSAKYRYVAKSRDDVKVLSPEWLEALRSVWMEGDDVDVAMLETQYRLPTFYGLKICLTGFENPEQRRYIQEMVDLNGAEYHGDLTKSVTHLIAAAPTGKKYEHAYQWRMKIVSFEWFEQSLQRTMALDEDCFHPTMPVEERGKGAWDRRRSTTPTIGKRTRDAENAQLLNISRRKLRRSASSKMGVQSDALWAGITASGLEKPRDEEDDWTEDSLPKQAITRAEARTKLATEVNTRQEDARADEDPASDALGPPSLLLKSKGGIFQGCIVFTHGFDEHKTTILRDHLDSNGANVIRSSDLERLCSSDLKRGFLVVPHDAKVDFTSLPAGAEIMGRATNWWVERCLHGKCLVDPSGDILSRPFDSFSINGFDGLIVNSTGFIGIELLHVTKVITLMGATYDEVLSAKTSVMICNSRSPNPEKIKFATSKQIPGVHATWLWDCIRIGEVQPYSNYLLNSLSQETATAKGKPRSSYAEVPTAPLSEEDSIKLRQKKKQPTRVPTKAGGPQRRTLDLTASLTPGSTTESSTRQNTSTDHLSPDQDEGLDGGYDGAASFPLQDINPSVNSPRRPSTSSAGSVTKPSSRRSSSSAEFLIQPAVAKGKSTVAKEPTSDLVIPAPDSTFQVDSELPAPAEGAPKELEKDYSTILSNLLANRKSAPSPADQGESKRRKHRTLGRAISSRSNPSTADDLLSRTSSAHNALDDDGEERENKNAYEYQPSQELGWDSPGAARTREQMIRRLGGKVEGRSVAVEGIGVVKDVIPSGAAGLASGRSTRKKRG